MSAPITQSDLEGVMVTNRLPSLPFSKLSNPRKFPLPLHPLSPTALIFFRQVINTARLIPTAVFAVIGGVKFLFGSVSLSWTPCTEIWAVYPQFVPDSRLSPL